VLSCSLLAGFPDPLMPHLAIKDLDLSNSSFQQLCTLSPSYIHPHHRWYLTCRMCCPLYLPVCVTDVSKMPISCITLKVYVLVVAALAIAACFAASQRWLPKSTVLLGARLLHRG
jgi:hypothetical protein